MTGSPIMPPADAYGGFTLSVANQQVEVAPLQDLTPSKFFDTFIAQRRPVLIKGHIRDELWGGPKWCNDYLKEKAGDAVVRVEYRAGSEDKYGQGLEKIMTFRQFLEELEAGNDKLYLTTQELEEGPDGRPEVISPPLTKLLGDFPLRPELMGRLVPQNLNLWMGYTPPESSSSSGLHHDYHDNLYLLLRGRKRFRLYSPADTHRMYTTGKVERVHPNGRINYEGQPTRQDGADPQADGAMLAARAVEAAEEEVAQQQRLLAAGEPGAGDRLEAAEIQLEEALEAVLEAQMGAHSEDGNGGSDPSSSEGEENEEAPPSPQRKRPRTAEKPGGGRPDNFSRVDTSLGKEELSTRYPLFLEAKGTTVEVGPGEMLYLPAGWFHEVESIAQSAGGHMAFNYWFHPPDMGQGFDAPYQSSLWQWDWEQRCKANEQLHAQR